ncbi:hypothetical protein SCG7109_BM_00020 [Chlamydiales bacterium SCGC AG-110-M15]|nr:hypothetical protein SCG7109_BM_00020 [Chlamydiales bacterium SCGC AG-110-M15]
MAWSHYRTFLCLNIGRFLMTTLNPDCYLIQPLSFRKIVRCNEDSAGHSFSYGQAV